MAKYMTRFWRTDTVKGVVEHVTFTFDSVDWSQPDLLGTSWSMATIRTVHQAAYAALPWPYRQTRKYSKPIMEFCDKATNVLHEDTTEWFQAEKVEWSTF